MRSSRVRNSLAASAVLATSVATAFTGLAPAANASPGGPSNSPLTISNGSSTIMLGSGGEQSTYLSNVADAAWAPDGSRVAYADGAGNIVTSRPDGRWAVIVTPSKAGVVRSHPTWIDGGAGIAFQESTAAGQPGTIEAVDANPGAVLTEGPPLGYNNLQPGAESSPDSAVRNLTFQHHNATTNTDEVWIQDGFGRGNSGTYFVANGTEPAVSPSGDEIAFRQNTNGVQQLWVAVRDSTTFTFTQAPVQVTFDAHDHNTPTWSPDGTRLAFASAAPGSATATDVESVAAHGAAPNTPKVESTTPGVPAYQPLVQDHQVRLAGGDRISTAVAVSQAAWGPAGSKNSATANAVVLTRSDQFADALGGSALASHQGPLLLTPSAALDGGVKAEIQRVLGPVDAANPKTVYLLGGIQALSPAVETEVRTLGYNVRRLAGPDRYATSVAIAHAVTDDALATRNPTHVLVATGDGFPDALSAGAAANVIDGSGYQAGVIILTHDKTMPAASAAYLAQVTGGASGAKIYGIGGQAEAALTKSGIQHTTVAGADRYQTSQLVAQTFFSGWNDTAAHRVGFATGLAWPDALSGGAYMGSVGGPLILLNPALANDSNDVQGWLSSGSSSIDTATFFGGTLAVSDPVMAAVTNEIDGPAGVVAAVNPKAS